MTNPIISIIVPNYNHENYLKQRLDSIFNQTFQNFEVILLDDSSTDSSIEILNTYRDHPKVSHFVVNKINSGSVFKQWSKGIELAIGKYVWIAESDDYAEPTFLEETFKVLETEKKSTLVYCDSRIVDENGVSLGYWKIQKNEYFKTNKWSLNHTCEGKYDVLNYLFYKTTINNASAVLFKRKSLSSNKFLNAIEKYKNVGDLYTYINVALQGNISYISTSLNNCRVHSENVTKKNIKSGVLYTEAIACFSKAIDWLTEKKLTTEEEKLLIRSSKITLLRFGFKLIDFNNFKLIVNFIKRCSKLDLFSWIECFTFLLFFRLYSLGETKFSKKILVKLLKK